MGKLECYFSCLSVGKCLVTPLTIPRDILMSSLCRFGPFKRTVSLSNLFSTFEFLLNIVFLTLTSKEDFRIYFSLSNVFHLL